MNNGRAKISNKDKVILDLCGGTGSWSKPYEDAGYNVILITLPDYSVCDLDFFDDMMIFKPQTILAKKIIVTYKDVYGILAAPPCTMFSFARTNAKTERNLREGMIVVEACLKIIWACQYQYDRKLYGYKTSLKFWSLENPNGFLKYFIGKAVFEFHPYEFGDMYSKNTSLWGCFNFPKKINNKKPEDNIKFGNHTMEKLREIRSISDIIFKDAKNRKMLRSITPPGFAKAFFEANQ